MPLEDASGRWKHTLNCYGGYDCVWYSWYSKLALWLGLRKEKSWPVAWDSTVLIHFLDRLEPESPLGRTAGGAGSKQKVWA